MHQQEQETIVDLFSQDLLDEAALYMIYFLAATTKPKDIVPHTLASAGCGPRWAFHDGHDGEGELGREVRISSKDVERLGMPVGNA